MKEKTSADEINGSSHSSTESTRTRNGIEETKDHEAGKTDFDHDIPDGGTKAWLCVFGVCIVLVAYTMNSDFVFL